MPDQLIESTGREGLSAWSTGWFSELGKQRESAKYLAGVAAWREAWRPERVKALLVAESHVAEVPGDATITVMPPAWIERDLPSQYVRLVYCLGYGESTICSTAPTKNVGTRQFWDILGQVAGGVGHVQPRSPATPEQRLRWKVDVLEQLRARGIWLEDASPIALYTPGGGRVASGTRYRRLVRDGYERFVWPGVAADRPEQIWIIGRGVASALAGLRGLDPDYVISQPQDRTPGRHKADLARMVDAIGRVA